MQACPGKRGQVLGISGLAIPRRVEGGRWKGKSLYLASGNLRLSHDFALYHTYVLCGYLTSWALVTLDYKMDTKAPPSQTQ